MQKLLSWLICLGVSAISLTSYAQSKPVIVGPYCANPNITVVHGTSPDPTGTTIKLFLHIGDQIGTTTVTATGDWSVTGLNLLPKDTVTAESGSGPLSDKVIIREAATTADAGTNLAICNSTTVALTGNSPMPSEMGTWSLVSGTGNISSPSMHNTSAFNLTIGAASVFKWVITDVSGTCSSSASVTITVSNPVAVPDAGNNQTLCGVSTTTLTADALNAGETGLWTTVSGTGTVSATGNPNTTATGLTAGNTTEYKWTVTNGACSKSDNVKIIVSNSVVVPDAGTDQTICNSTTATLTADALNAGETGLWTRVSGTGTVTPASINSPTATATGLTAGNTTEYKWTVTNGACSSSDNVSITVSNPVAVPNAGADKTLCSASTTTLTADVLNAGETGLWTTVSGTGTVTPASINSPTATATGLTAGNTTEYKWTVTNGACSKSDTVKIIVSNSVVVPDAGTDQTICNSTTATLTADALNAGETGLWTTISGTGTVSPTNLSTTTVTGLTVGNTSEFKWTVSNGACNESDNVKVLVKNATTIANAGSDQTDASMCDVTTTTLTANAPAVGETGVWSGGTGGSFGNASSPTSTFSGTAGSTYTLTWTISNPPCSPSSSDVVIKFNRKPTTANAGTDQTGSAMCGKTSTTLAANTPTIGTGGWSIISGTGGSFGGTASSPTSNFSGTAGQTYVLRWTITNPPCNPNYKDVTIAFPKNPTPANAGPDQDTLLCGLTSTTLAANNPIVGTGEWSIVSGTGGTLTDKTKYNTSFSGTAGASYTLLWTVTNDACTSSDPVTIIFGVIPTTAIAGIDQTLCSSTTTLDGNTASTGSGKWNKVSGSGSPSSPFSNNSGVTGLGPGTSVYAWVITSGACVSSDTMKIFNGTVPTVDAGVNQTLCNVTTATLAGNTPTSGTGAWTLKPGTGPGTITTPGTPNSGITGLAPGDTSVFVWTITDAACSASDTVAIIVNAPPSIANAGTNQTICSDATALSATPPAIGKGQWQVVGTSSVTITDDSKYNTIISNLPIGITNFSWTVSNGACPANSSTVSITRDATPTQANAGQSQTLCVATATTTATLYGNEPQSGETGTWTTVSGTTITPTSIHSPTTTITGLPIGGPYIFKWTISNGNCPTSDNVEITVGTSPTIANAGTDQTICAATTYTLTGNPPATGETGLWTLVTGTGTITATNTPTTTVTGLTPGTSSVFEWSISKGICSSSASVTITVSKPATIADAGMDQTICAITTYTLTANAPVQSGETGLWTIVSGTGTVIATSTPTTTITGLTPGTTSVLAWTIANGLCSSSDTIKVNVSEAATVPNAGADQTLCGTTTVTLTANTPTVGIGKWSIVSGTGGNITTLSNPTSAFSGTAGTPYILAWTITNGACSISDNVKIDIGNVPTKAIAGSDQSLCSVSTATLTANAAGAGETGLWSKIFGQGNIASNNNPTTLITGLSAGDSSVFKWTITNGLCNSPDTIIVKVSGPPTVANAGTDQTICSSNATLNGNTPVIGKGTWTLVSGDGSATSPNSPASDVTGLKAGTAVFRWTIANGTCTSFDEVSIINGNVPVIDAGLDQALCNATGTTLMANTPAVGSAAWTKISGPGAIASASTPTTTVTGLTAGDTTVFRWTITDGVCVATDDVSVIVNTTPSTANAGADQTDALMCGITTTTLTATTPTVGKGTWSIISGTGGSFGDVTKPNSTFSGTPDAPYTLRWAVSSPPCTASTDDVVIFFRQPPTTAIAGMDQTGANMCGQTLATLTANIPLSGTGQWNIVSGGVGSFGNSASPTSTFIGTAGSIYTLQWTISNPPCAPSTDMVTVSFWQTPTTANAGTDQTLCTDTTTLSGNNPAIGKGLWTKISGSGNITTPANPTSKVIGLTSGTSVFRWTITGDSCTSFDDVSITYNGIAIVNAGTDQSICNGTTTTLSGNVPTIGTGIWTKISGGGNITTPTNSTTGVTGLTPGTSVFRWIITNSTCSASDEVIIHVGTTNTIANAGPDQAGSSMCGLTSTTLAANTPLEGVGRWTVVSGNGGSFVDSTNRSTLFSGAAGTSYVLRWTISNNACPPSSDDVTIIFWDSPTIADAGPDQISFAKAATLAGNTPIVGTGKWTVIAGGATITSPNDSKSVVTGLAQGINTFRWTISSPPCPDSYDDININAQLNNLAPVAKNDTVIIPEDSSASINVQANDSDPNLDLLTTSIVKGPAHGIASLNGKNIDYSPTKNFNGLDTIVYAVCDSASVSLCDTAIVLITVTPVNDKPIIKTDTSVTVKANLPTEICIPIKDVDFGQTYEVSSCENPAHGTYNTTSISSNRFCITYTPNLHYDGADSICLVVCDNGIPSLCDTAHIKIKVLKEPIIEFEISEGFSPNGDGVNETFIINGIDKYPHNHIMIFNQWGNLVYKIYPYENKWDGTISEDHHSPGGKLLPSGTYYFILDLGDGTAPIKKYVYLSR